MADEPETPSPAIQPPAPAEAHEKGVRKARKPGQPKSQGLPTTEAGEKVADDLQKMLIEMVKAAALTEANRRRATAIDATDFEAGFDLIAGPRKQLTAIAVIADIANAVGSGLIGYSINVYTGDGGDSPRGHLAMIGGLALLLISIILKYVTWPR